MNRSKSDGEDRESSLRAHRLAFVVVGVAGGVLLGSELVIRVWLEGIGSEILRSLRLLSLTAATTLAVAVVTFWMASGAREASFGQLPVTERPHWIRRIQSVSLRTKLIVPMVGLAVVPALGIGAYTIFRMQETLEQTAIERIQFATASRERSLTDFVSGMEEDLLFVANLGVLRNLADALADGDAERVARLRSDAEHELQVFSQSERAYYQVRYLDADGHEVVRLNVVEGLPAVVPQDELQDKSSRYYVQAGMAGRVGEIYTSQMDLNVEHGVVEIPHRGVIRYATRVIGSRGQGHGLLIINVDADYLISLAGSLPSGEDMWLIGEHGTYLGHCGSSPERPEVFELEQGRPLAADFSPEQTSRILQQREGTGTLEADGSLFAFTSIGFAPQAPHRTWTLLVSHSAEKILPAIRHVTASMLMLVGIIIAVGATLGILVARYLAQPVEILRKATRAIAAGELSQQVAITTADEIEGLATDFNTMAEQLSRAQDQLAAWNEELEREVADQTERLHSLQSGFARADKLASIGQMTAGVMHEVGNPLAALKARIQVAEEDEALCANCRDLLDDLLDEVNRLAKFLHSFSRLARLPAPERRVVALSEIIDGVVTLTSAELRQRGICLQVSQVPPVSTIRGDADRLRHLFINLVLNAADASEGGGEVEIRLHLEDDKPEDHDLAASAARRVVVDVVDHGAGMPPEVIARIWDPFFTTKQKGTGLGLSISHEIIRHHGGSVEILSEPGLGTTVSVSLPLEESDVGTNVERVESAASTQSPHVEEHP
ncbi:MAG: ATP-binding protein [Myxococcota bacterium]|jgi:signal transduction histidine kinase|nr:ATP-binding protein [Myxococcota bacterium]